MTMFFPALLACMLLAETPDTLLSSRVSADRGAIVSRTDTLPADKSLTVTEILQKNPSITINDNGGLAGLKTISLRGLGSPHTAIFLDGLRVGNVQSGQSDISMFTFEDCGRIVLDYARNSLSLETSRPARTGGRASLKAGSFGTWLPSLRADFKAGRDLFISASAAGAFSKGDFPLADGTRRVNNDIREGRGSLDFFGSTAGGVWHAKAHLNKVCRGVAGSTAYPSEDRQKDMNALVQGLFRQNFGSVYSLTASVKASYDKLDYLSTWGDSNFGQTEFQLNSTHSFNISGHWSASASADIRWDAMKSTEYEASRLGADAAVSAIFQSGSFKADASLLFEGTWDRGAASRAFLSPALGLRYDITGSLTVNGFVRRACRIPTFNELYYKGYGNPELKPEDAMLSELGADFHKALGRNWTLKAKAAAYCNILKDKITSAPSPDNPSIWMPLNIGLVKASGADAQMSGTFTGDRWELTADARYSFQSARDMTEGSSGYGEQIAYVPRHGATAGMTAAYQGWKLSGIWNIRTGRSDSLGAIPDWNTLDLSLSKGFSWPGKCSTLLKLSCRNLTDTRYEISSGYPMEGRSMTAGIDFKW